MDQVPPDANTIALVSVIGASATAICVPLINGAFAARADQRKFAYERREKDLDERRALLDDGAHALTEYIDAAIGVMTRFAFLAQEAEARDLDFYREQLDANVAAKLRCYALNRRLVIRLGRNDDVVLAYGSVLQMLDEATTYLVRKIHEVMSGTPDAQLEVFERQNVLRASWYEAHERYLDAATNLVGSPSTATRSANTARRR